MDRDFDMEKVIDKMRMLRDTRDLEILEGQLNDIKLDTDYKKELPKDKVINVKYLGVIDWEEEIDGENIKSEKEIYLVIEQKEDENGNLIEIERYYTEDGELLGGNNKSDNYDYVMLNEKYANISELQSRLQSLDKEGILDLNEIEHERLEKIAIILGIRSEDIDKLAELSDKEIENAEKELDEQEEKEQEEVEENGNKDGKTEEKETLTKKEVEKISSKTEIDTSQKVNDKDTMASLLNVQGKGYIKIAVIYSDKLQGNESTTKFSFVGINKDGSAEKIDSLEQVGGIRPDKEVYGMNYDGSKIEEQQMNSIYRIKGQRENQVAVKIGTMGTIETSLLRSPQYNNKEAISIPIQNKYNMNPTTRETREFMSEQRNPRMNEEIERIEKHKESGCEEPLSKRDIDDNLSKDTNKHVETMDKMYLSSCVKEILKDDVIASNYGRDYVKEKVVQKITESKYLSKDEIIDEVRDELKDKSQYEHEEIEHDKKIS